MFAFFSSGPGCLGSILISVAGTHRLLALLNVI
jgi:hypothetical protein